MTTWERQGRWLLLATAILVVTILSSRGSEGFVHSSSNNNNNRILPRHDRFNTAFVVRLRTLPASADRSQNQHQKSTTATRTMLESLFATGTTEQGGKSKKKKNKYAQFSKVGQIEKDPFEALVEESEQKLRSLQDEKRMDPLRRQEQEILNYGGTLPGDDNDDTSFKRLEFPNTTEIDPYDATSFGYMEIGTMVGPHGVHGWIKVQGSTDYPERLTRAGMILHLKPPRRRAPRQVTLVTGKQIDSNDFLIQLQGVYNRTAATKLKGSTLYYATQQDTLVDRDDGEILVSDLVGLQVYRRRGENDDEGSSDEEERILVGTVQGVVLAEEMCAVPGLLHDQLEIQVAEEQGIKPEPGRPPKLVLIPMVPEIVPKVDLEEQTIVIDPPAGLLDLVYVREEKVKIKGLLAPAERTES